MSKSIPVLIPSEIHSIVDKQYTQVHQLLGKRLALMFGYLIAQSAQSAVFSAFFRKNLLELGENPDLLEVEEDELLVILFGSKIATEGGKIPDELYEALTQRYSQEQVSLLVSFATQLVAATMFNATLEVQVEASLQPYVLPEAFRTELCLV